MLRKLCCLLGFHQWQTAQAWRKLGGTWWSGLGRACDHCGRCEARDERRRWKTI